jgi:hypothetical protein
MAAAEEFLNGGMIRSCLIFSIFSQADIFSLRSKPEFANNAVKDCEEFFVNSRSVIKEYPHIRESEVFSPGNRFM